MMIPSRSLTATEIVENTVSEAHRKKRSEQMKEEYPNYVPVFIKYWDSDNIYRNIIHHDVPFLKLLFIIRQKRKISPTLGLMSLIEKDRDPKTGDISTLQVPTTQNMGQISEKYLHSDGFLYLNVCTENVFG